MGCCYQRYKIEPDHYKTIAFVGPQKSGKTSLIYYLKNRQIKKQYEETKHIQQDEFQFQEKLYELKDLPAYNDQVKVDAWVYVIDNNNLYQVQELNDFLKQQDGEKPVLLLKNKCDLSTQQQQIDDSQILRGNIKKFQVLKTSNNGERVEMGFEWLHQELNNK